MVTIPVEVGASVRHQTRHAWRRDGRPSRILAAAAMLLLGCGAAGLALLQAAPGARDLDPVAVPLSSYALSGAGALFDASVGALAAASVLLGCASLLRAAGADRVMAGLLCGTGVGLSAVAVFPDTVTAMGSPTGAGWAHLAACVPVFAGPPAAGCRARARGRSPLSRLAGTLALLAGMVALVMCAGLVIPWASGMPEWDALGLVERVLTGVDVAGAGVLAAWVWRRAGSAAVTPLTVADESVTAPEPSPRR